MKYEIRTDVPLPAVVSRDTAVGRTKYPFKKLRPVTPNAKAPPTIVILDEEDARKAEIRMRAYARENKIRMRSHTERDDAGNFVRLIIWRTN